MVSEVQASKNDEFVSYHAVDRFSRRQTDDISSCFS